MVKKMFRRHRPPFMLDILRFILLKLIIEKPSHGYMLRQKFRSLTKNVWVPSYSMIYPILHELVEYGLVDRKPEIKGKKIIYVYYPTELGKNVYKERKNKLSEKILRMLDESKKYPHHIPILLFFTTDLGLMILDDLYGEKKKEILIRLKEIVDKISEKIEKIIATM